MDFEDRPMGLEERISGLSEGQRYALALVLNLAFVGAVIAAMALLYTTTGFKSRPSAPTAEAPVIDDPAEPPSTLALDEGGGPVSLALPSESPLSPGLDAAPPAPSDERQLASVAEPRLAAEARRSQAPANPPPAAPAPSVAPVAPAAPAATEAPASPWEAAATLTAELQKDFPCSLFTLQAGTGGGPLLRARVGPSDDIGKVRTRLQDAMGDGSDVAPGVGCTTVVGGGYIALSDENGEPLILDGASLSREIRAVLPGEGTCAVIGQMVAAQPALQQRLDATGRPATWVRSNGAAALCERDKAGSWRVAAGGDLSTRKAAAVVLGDDTVGLEVRRFSNLPTPILTVTAPAVAAADTRAAAAAPTSEASRAALTPQAQTPSRTTAPAAPAPQTAAPAPSAAEDVTKLASAAVGAAAPPVTPPTPRTAPRPPAADVGSSFTAGAAPAAPAKPPAPAPKSAEVVEVAPTSGPAPKLPEGVTSSPDGYAVDVAFTVDAQGKASDLNVVSAGAANTAVVMAALDIVSASSFPPAAAGATYRGKHTVRFPSAASADLLNKLSSAMTDEPTKADPLWDRQLTQADYDRYYPARALQRDVTGQVTLKCKISFDGSLQCTVAEEKPGSWGFGGAAISLSGLMRAGPRMSDGTPAANREVLVHFDFGSAKQ